MEIKLKPSTKHELHGIYLPAVDAKAAIIMVHGLGEHISRYKEMAAYFNSRNYSFIGVDLPGHGRSSGKRGHIDNFGQYNDIISAMADLVRRREGDIPLVLYGHSLGGAVALNYLASSALMDKAIVTSPWLRLAVSPSPFKIFLAGIMNKLMPGLLQKSGLNPDDISSDKNVVKKYRTDPLVHNKISVRLFASATANAHKLLEMKESVSIPVLLMHSADDRITSAGGSEVFADRNSKAELKIWEKGLHELHNEVFRDEVFDYIIKWLE
ncbi:MAG: alpha/beta hydrolase [Bacteroidales bacterium]|nr:alpha/beta hydrolase [Bacteroidales bacterium]